MAFPVDAGRLNTNGSTAGTNKVCNLRGSGGGNPLSGDLLILILRSAGADTHSTPTGWTQLVLNNTADASDDTTSIWYRVADGSEGASVTVNGTASLKFAAECWAITGHDSATAPVVSAITTGTSTTPNPASLTPAGGANDFLWMWLGGWEGEQTSPPAGSPTNYSNPAGANSGVAGVVATNCRVAGATRQLNAASEDPPSWTISASDDWSAWTVAVYPAGAITVSPSAIASAEAFGSARQSFLFSPGGIASLEAFGVAKELLTLLGAGLASAEAFGAVVVTSGTTTISPSSIGSLEAFGTAKEILSLFPSGLGSGEAFGSPRQVFLFSPSGLASLEAFGTARETLTLFLSGLASGEAIGAHVISVLVTLSPIGIASAEVFGNLQRPAKHLIGEDEIVTPAEVADAVWDELLSGHAIAGSTGAGMTAIKGKTDTLPSGIQKNTALANFTFLMVDSADHVTPKTGLTVTAQRSLDGAAFAPSANSPAELGNGVYKINLAASDLNGDIVTLKFTATGADQRTVSVVTEP